MPDSCQPDVELGEFFPSNDEIPRFTQLERRQLYTGVDIAYDAGEIPWREWCRVLDALEAYDPTLVKAFEQPSSSWVPNVWDEVQHAGHIVLVIIFVFVIGVLVGSWFPR